MTHDLFRLDDNRNTRPGCGGWGWMMGIKICKHGDFADDCPCAESHARIRALEAALRNAIDMIGSIGPKRERDVDALTAVLEGKT